MNAVNVYIVVSCLTTEKPHNNCMDHLVNVSGALLENCGYIGRVTKKRGLNAAEGEDGENDHSKRKK